VPEGDTVWLTAKRLHEALAGRRLVAADLRLPDLATVDLAGRAVVDTAARGKHLLTRLDDGRTLHSHLRMDGSWRIFGAGERWRGGRPYEVRVVLATSDRQAVGYRLHDVALLATADEEQLVGHLGPDLLGPDWDPEEAVRRLCGQPNRAIGEALLDQRNLAGIGNLYKAEVLFLQGIHPWTPISAVPDLTRLVTLAQRMLFANRERWEQVTTGSRRRGEEHYVYDRARWPCRRCGAPIAVAEQGRAPHQRPTYWCPHCQPAPPGATVRRLPVGGRPD
jgi:endonuclease-8